MKLFQTGPDRYQPNRAGGYATVNQRGLALLVGLVALGLPIALLVGALNPFWNTCFRDSISHYYYAQFWGGPFIGALVFIGAFLLVYQGEDENGAERRLASIASVFAFGVALFPTNGHGCDDGNFSARALAQFETNTANELALKLQGLSTYFELFPFASTLHYICAASLFAFLAWFALVVFTSEEPHQRTSTGGLTQKKTIRNALYYFSGTIMLACMAAMALYAALDHFDLFDMSWWNAGNWTFWCEALALWAFGISWMVKGRFLGRLKDATD